MCFELFCLANVSFEKKLGFVNFTSFDRQKRDRNVQQKYSVFLAAVIFLDDEMRNLTA